MNTSNQNLMALAKDFDSIKTRLLISGIIVLTSQLHIGVGDDYTKFSPESGILMTKFGTRESSVPYIPNTTLKGIFRSETERIAEGLSKINPNTKYLCTDFPNNQCNVEGDEKGDQPCAICRIFGTNGLGAHIIISDALPTKETMMSFQTKLKPGIAINREKQVRRDKSLFFIETLQPGAKFHFQLIVNNIAEKQKPIEFSLLRTLFAMIQFEALSIGGKRSTGMGKFRLEESSVRLLVNKQDFLFPEQVPGSDIASFFNLK